MAQIDTYLSHIAKENTLDMRDDILSLYETVRNDDLKKIFAVYHTQLNKWFAEINSAIRYNYDENEERVYTGGYFNAQDSREYLHVVDQIEQLKNKCNSSEYSFQICDKYSNAIRDCYKFIVKSGGSHIPENFPPIDIEDLSPVFCLEQCIAISHSVPTYAHLKLIGEGSYANVFSYTDPVYSIPIALKRAKPHLDSKELLRFKQEFDILKKLSSPYIIQVYSYNEEKHEYTMERMDDNIYRYIQKNNNKLSLTSRKKFIAQLCHGLSYMHRVRVLHRDISLTNIFVKHYDDLDIVKIGDFGLAKNPESTLTSQQTEIKGSLNDPDLIRVGFSNYSIQHETYALTRLCFFILTGKTNIDRQNDGKIKDFWNRGTDPDLSKRFQSVDELYEFVRKIDDDNK